MADAERVWHGTLAAATVRTVELGKNYRSVEVLNVDGVAAVYVNVGSTVNAPKDPATAQADADVLPAAISSVEIPSPDNGNTVVKLISAGGPQVSVRGLL